MHAASRNFINFVQKLTMTWNGELHIYLNFNYRSTCAEMVKFGGRLVNGLCRLSMKINFCFCIFWSWNFKYLCIPISTNILQEILVWVWKWNRLGFLLLWSNLKFHLLTKNHLKYSHIFFMFSLLLYDFHKSILNF